MIDMTTRIKSVTDREKWAARGASVLAKAKATKQVWFPPEPEKAAKKTASTARKTTRKRAAAAKGTTKKVGSPVARKKASAAKG